VDDFERVLPYLLDELSHFSQKLLILQRVELVGDVLAGFSRLADVVFCLKLPKLADGALSDVDCSLNVEDFAGAPKARQIDTLHLLPVDSTWLPRGVSKLGYLQFFVHDHLHDAQIHA